MDIERAMQLLAGLADGVDPLTGELLPDNSVCNRAEIVRAFHCILNTLAEKPPEREKTEKSRHENAYMPWTEADDEELCRMFDAGAKKRELCKHFKRSEGSIASRLERLGLIDRRKDFSSMR